MASQIQRDTVFQRLMAALCLLLMLTITGVEAVHVHAGDGSSGSSGTSCLICMSVHANAPALTGHSLPALFEVGMIVVAYETEATGIASRLELFTRPPPLSA